MVPTATRELINLLGGEEFPDCKSASLRLEKFVRVGKQPEGLKQQEVKRVCDTHNQADKEAGKKNIWKVLEPPATMVYHAKLNSRLLVNHAGGALENAGLCLHRHFGIPYIPGSAVKGCARRMAVQDITDSDSEERKQELVLHTALVFGWGDGDWKEGTNKHDEFISDFAYACNEAFCGIRAAVCTELATITGDDRRKDFDREKPWKKLSSFAGLVSFMHAFPNEKPSLVPDVLTCHHMEYYGGKRQEDFMDTESPNPQFFPAVEAGSGFVFQVLPCRRSKRLALPQSFDPASFAIDCLRRGLDDFGIGAKTNAGYGWFVEDTEAKKEVENNQCLANAQASPEIITELEALPEDQLAGRVNQFHFPDHKYWPKDRDDTYMLSLFEFCVNVKPEAWQKFKSNPKGKSCKAINNLSKRFNRSLP